MAETVSVIAKLRDRFTETLSEGEILIMRLDTGEILSLAGTAASAWSLIDGTRNRDALIAALTRHYSAEREEIAADVDHFLRDLEKSGLIADA